MRSVGNRELLSYMNFTIWYSCLTSQLQLTEGSVVWSYNLFNDPVYRTIRCNLTLTTDCTVFFTARSKSKDADWGKCGATNVHLTAAQKFLSLDCLYEMWIMASVVTKLHAIEMYKYLYRLLVAGSKTDFASSLHWFSATEILPLKSFSSAVTIDFYALWYSRSDASLLCVSPFVRMYQGGFHWRDFHVILYWRLALKYLNLVKIGQKYGTLYITT